MRRKPVSPATPFMKVFDSAGHAVRGLWKRGLRFYAQLAMPEAGQENRVRRVSLDATTMAEAKLAMDRLRVQRADGQIEPRRDVEKVPTFEEYSKVFLSRQLGLNKRPRTEIAYKSSLQRVYPTLGGQILVEIRPKDIHAAARSLREAGYAARTVNHSLTAIRLVFMEAIKEELLQDPPPTKGIELLPIDPHQRPFFSLDQIRMVAEATGHDRGRDLILLLALSGCRVGEGINLKWHHIDMEAKTITIPYDIAKGRRDRTIHMNSLLRDHLQGMYNRRGPTSDYLFPSARFAGRPMDEPRKHLERAKAKTGIDLQYHDCRRYFASWCCLQGVPVNVAAAWLGHHDGGALLLKTYAKLNDRVARDQADRLVAM